MSMASAEVLRLYRQFLKATNEIKHTQIKNKLR